MARRRPQPGVRAPAPDSVGNAHPGATNRTLRAPSAATSTGPGRGEREPSREFVPYPPLPRTGAPPRTPPVHGLCTLGGIAYAAGRAGLPDAHRAEGTRGPGQSPATTEPKPPGKAAQPAPPLARSSAQPPRVKTTTRRRERSPGHDAQLVPAPNHQGPGQGRDHRHPTRPAPDRRGPEQKLPPRTLNSFRHPTTKARTPPATRTQPNQRPTTGVPSEAPAGPGARPTKGPGQGPDHGHPTIETPSRPPGHGPSTRPGTQPPKPRTPRPRTPSRFRCPTVTVRGKEPAMGARPARRPTGEVPGRAPGREPQLVPASEHRGPGRSSRPRARGSLAARLRTPSPALPAVEDRGPGAESSGSGRGG